MAGTRRDRGQTVVSALNVFIVTVVLIAHAPLVVYIASIHEVYTT